MLYLMLYDLQHSEPLYRLEEAALDATLERRDDGSVAFRGEQRKIEPEHQANTYRVRAKYSIETDDRTDLIAFFYASVGVKIVVDDDAGLEIIAAGPVAPTVRTNKLLLGASPAFASNVPAGYDLFETVPGRTFQDFSLAPIPRSFFDPVRNPSPAGFTSGGCL